MRKRSCAIHSESAEQYIQLSKSAQNKTGLFYDQVLNPEEQVAEKVKHHSGSKLKKMNTFSHFDYNQPTELENDQTTLNTQINKMHYRTVKNVIICDGVENTIQTLWGPKHRKDEQPDREIDLVVRKFPKSDNSWIIIKYWVIHSSGLNSPLIQVYLNSVSRLYSMTKMSLDWENSIICSSAEILASRIQEHELADIKN